MAYVSVLLERKLPIARASMPLFKQHDTASAGLITIGSCRLKLVLRITGTPVPPRRVEPVKPDALGEIHVRSALISQAGVKTSMSLMPRRICANAASSDNRGHS